MARCKRCGKGGLFFKINADGICNDCERIEGLEAEEKQLKSRIERLISEYSRTEQSRIFF
jgi:hypothetical protein